MNISMSETPPEQMHIDNESVEIRQLDRGLLVIVKGKHSIVEPFEMVPPFVVPIQLGNMGFKIHAHNNKEVHFIFRHGKSCGTLVVRHYSEHDCVRAFWKNFGTF